MEVLLPSYPPVGRSFYLLGMREFTLPYSYRSAFIIYYHPNHFQAGVFLHIMADALGSIVVMISASVIWLTDWKYKYVLLK